MIFFELKKAAESASRIKLPDVAQALWKAVAAGHVTETQAEEVDGLLRDRMAVPSVAKVAIRRVGSRPRSDQSMERRRKWASAGRLPPQVACRFTLAEQAVMAVVAMEVGKRGDCRLTLEHIAAIAGVSRSTVKAAIRHAQKLGLLTVEERRQSTWRSLSNVVRVISREWLAWMRLGSRSPGPEGGVKFSTTTSTKIQGKALRERPVTLERAAGRSGSNGR